MFVLAFVLEIIDAFVYFLIDGFLNIVEDNLHFVGFALLAIWRPNTAATFVLDEVKKAD